VFIASLQLQVQLVQGLKLGKLLDCKGCFWVSFSLCFKTNLHVKPLMKMCLPTGSFLIFHMKGFAWGLVLKMNKGWKFLKKLWCCVGGGSKVIWLYQLSWKCKLATVMCYKADVSSVSPSSERMLLRNGLLGVGFWGGKKKMW